MESIVDLILRLSSPDALEAGARGLVVGAAVGIALLGGLLLKIAYGYTKRWSKDMTVEQRARICLLFLGACFLFALNFFTEELEITRRIEWALFYSPTFYSFVKFYIFSLGIYYAVAKYKENKIELASIALAVGILFNPFLAVGLSSSLLGKTISAIAILFLISREKSSK